MRAMLNRRHDLTLGRSVGAQPVGDQSPRRTALLFQQALQHALGRFGVATRLDDLIEHIAILIDSPPQPVLLTGNGDDNLVEEPNIAAVRPLAFEATGVVGPELQGPPANDLIGDDHAALEQHLLDQSQAQWKSEIEPYRVGNDFGWKAVAF